MKKFYKDPVKKPRPKVKKPELHEEMPEELKKFHDEFYSDTGRLEREWNLCRDQYEAAAEKVKTKNIKFPDKMAIQKIAKYWSTRKSAMERALPKETIKQFKASRNKK